MAEVVHISEEEAARDVKALFERVRSGEHLLVEASDRPAVMMLSTEPVKVRSITETIKALENRKETPSGPGRPAQEIIRGLAEWQAKHGKLVMDEDFADDLEDIHRLYNQPMDGSKWD